MDEDRQDLANPLGISGEPVPQDESDRIRASNDEASVRRRRQRAGLGPDVTTAAPTVWATSSPVKGSAGLCP